MSSLRCATSAGMNLQQQQQQQQHRQCLLEEEPCEAVHVVPYMRHVSRNEPAAAHTQAISSASVSPTASTPSISSAAHHLQGSPSSSARSRPSAAPVLAHQQPTTVGAAHDSRSPLARPTVQQCPFQPKCCLLQQCCSHIDATVTDVNPWHTATPTSAANSTALLTHHLQGPPSSSAHFSPSAALVLAHQQPTTVGAADGRTLTTCRARHPAAPVPALVLPHCWPAGNPL
jgi:hypothetical protein